MGSTTKAGIRPLAPLAPAASFLRIFGDDHLLCSKNPDEGGMHCYRGNIDEVIRWAQVENAAGRNIYYHFNRVRAGLNKRSSEGDITHIRGLPDDLDWGWEKHRGRYPERLLELINQQQQLQNSPTPPTISVFTGGGFQNLYLFASLLKATPQTIHRVKTLSRCLVAERGSDMMGNPDRLLRLPGFTNYPHQKKAAAGQQERMASVIFTSARTYSLEELEVAFRPQNDRSIWSCLGLLPAGLMGQPCDDELGAGIERPPLDLETIASAAQAVPGAGTYRAFVNGEHEVRAYNLAKRDDWLSCALFPAVYGVVEYPEHETVIRELFHHVSSKGIAGSYDPAQDVGKKNDEKLDDEIGRVRSGHVRNDHPSLYRWISMAKESGCLLGRVTSTGNRRNAPQWPEVCRDGSPKSGYRNAIEAVRVLGLTCAHDTFHGRKTIGGHHIARFAGELHDDALAVLRKVIADEFNFDPRKDHLYEAVNALCVENSFDPVCDWLEGLVWDGIPRLGTWLIDYAAAADTPLNRATGTLLLIAMVRRAKQPGCKFDIMVVLEGAQGCGKSSLIALLAGYADNFTDAPTLHANSREVAETIYGKWVVEFSELAGMAQRDVDDLKAMISRADDRARLAYARNAENHPRRCVFVGTTNADEYLRDDTGNRRFVPVRVGDINLDRFKDARDQLFAEAVELERNHGPLTLPEPVWKAAAREAEERLLTDPWTEQLREVLNPATGAHRHLVNTLSTGERRIATTDVAEALGLQARDLNPTSFKRIASAMRALGFKRDHFRPAGGGAKARGFTKGS